MNIQQIRSATIIINFAGKRFLFDPMFTPKDGFPPIPECFTPDRKWPLVDLPMPVEKIVENIDAVIMTHYHFDHFDEYAIKALSKDTKVFVQDDYDKNILLNFGFNNVEIIKDDGSTHLEEVKMYKTNCVHGIKATTMPYFSALNIRHEAMGVVFKNADEKTLYLAGDTIWSDCVKEAIEEYKPDIIIVNAAKARMLKSGPIIMGEEDIEKVHEFAPKAKIIASHMDTVGHATLNRTQLREFVVKNNLSESVLIPEDGDIIEFKKE